MKVWEDEQTIQWRCLRSAVSLVERGERLSQADKDFLFGTPSPQEPASRYLMSISLERIRAESEGDPFLSSLPPTVFETPKGTPEVWQRRAQVAEMLMQSLTQEHREEVLVSPNETRLLEEYLRLNPSAAMSAELLPTAHEFRVHLTKSLREIPLSTLLTFVPDWRHLFSILGDISSRMPDEELAPSEYAAWSRWLYLVDPKTEVQRAYVTLYKSERGLPEDPPEDLA
jgi:hypothetical protein